MRRLESGESVRIVPIVADGPDLARNRVHRGHPRFPLRPLSEYVDLLLGDPSDIMEEQYECSLPVTIGDECFYPLECLVRGDLPPIDGDRRLVEEEFL